MQAYIFLASQTSVCTTLRAIEDKGPLRSQRPALLFPAESTEMQQPLLSFGPCLLFLGSYWRASVPGHLLSTFLLISASSLCRELNGNNITRINKNDFAGLKQLRVL